MKFLIIAIGLTLGACNPTSSESDIPSGDCRPSAEVVRTSPAGLQVTFSESVAEVVDGSIHCDFGYNPTKVENPSISGKALNLTDREDSPVYTIHDATVDLKDPLSFELDGTSYISDPSSIEQTENRLKVRMRRFPPK